jgi:hypothetical protein
LLFYIGEIMTLKKGISITLVALCLVGFTLALTTYSAVNSSVALKASGTVSTTVTESVDTSWASTLRLYCDNACSTPLTSLDWGSIKPGDSITKIVYLKNTGTAPLSLNLATANWEPSTAFGPLSITWDKQGTQIAADEVTTAAITLIVSPYITGVSSFTVQIVLSGTR